MGVSVHIHSIKMGAAKPVSHLIAIITRVQLTKRMSVGNVIGLQTAFYNGIDLICSHFSPHRVMQKREMCIKVLLQHSFQIILNNILNLTFTA